MSKVYLDYEMLKNLCLSMADQIKEFAEEKFKDSKIYVVAVSRGGMTPAHIVAKRLNVECYSWKPNETIIYPLDYDINNGVYFFIEDVYSTGRTFSLFSRLIFTNKFFVPVVVDAAVEKNIDLYGIKTKHWICMPWEETEKVVEGDRGLFRDGTTQYDSIAVINHG